MNTLIRTALVISSVALSFAANATNKSTTQENLARTTNDVVTMLSADMKVNAMDLKLQLKFEAPKMVLPASNDFQRLAYVAHSSVIRTIYKPQ